MKPNFLNLFMNILTRGRVAPMISARVSWLICIVIGCGPPCCPKFASRRSVRAQSLFAGVENLVYLSSSTRLLKPMPKNSPLQ
jgi:hypothetical protein